MGEKNSKIEWVQTHQKVKFDPALKGPAKEDTLLLDGGRWNQIRMHDYCPYMKKWKLRKLNIGGNDRITIIKQIKHIQFPYLTYLALGGNSLFSIESIIQIQMPLLEQLRLNSNVLRSIKPMIKKKWMNLKDIIINNNYLTDTCLLTELQANKLKWIHLQIQTTVQYCGDISWVSKLKSKDLKGISTGYDTQNVRVKKGYDDKI